MLALLDGVKLFLDCMSVNDFDIFLYFFLSFKITKRQRRKSININSLLPKLLENSTNVCVAMMMNVCLRI